MQNFTAETPVSPDPKKEILLEGENFQKRRSVGFPWMGQLSTTRHAFSPTSRLIKALFGARGAHIWSLQFQ